MVNRKAAAALSKVFNWRNLDNLRKPFDVYDLLDAESATDCKKLLKSLRTSNPEKLAFAHLNMNSIRNKFEMLSDQIKDKIEVLLGQNQKSMIPFPLEIFNRWVYYAV